MRIATILKLFADTSAIECDEIITVMDIVSIQIYVSKNTDITANVTSTVLINFYGKKVRDSYVLHAVLLVIILLLKVIIICYYHTKQKGINALTI